MNIFITGGSGFIGQALSRFFIEKGHSVTGVGRSAEHRFSGMRDFTWISADTTKAGEWQAAVKKADVIVNLAGKSIFAFGTKENKEAVYNSRILTTRHVVDALPKGKKPLLLNASAVGFYGDRQEDLLTEHSAPGSDFLARVVMDWEHAALSAHVKGTRVVAMRFGVVLGKQGGAVKKMLPAFKLFAGGPMGSGKNWFPWIHIDDLIAAVGYCIEHKDIKGPVNFCSHGFIRQRQFTKALGKALKRPWILRTPAFAVRLIMGEMAVALLGSQKAYPESLLTHGFSFRFTDIDRVLRDLAG